MNNENKKENKKNQTEKPAQRPLAAILLAAGKGTRMKSPLPKVLHPVAGTPMIHYPIMAAKEADIEDIRVVVGHGQNLVRQVVEPLGVSCFVQAEQKGTADASADTLKIREINTGIYVVRADVLQDYLPKIKSNNSKGEFYLTDIISLSIEDGLKVDAIKSNKRVARGVNTQAELALATKYHYQKKAKELLEAGVVILDPATVYVEKTVTVGSGSVLYPNIFLKGKSKIGAFSVVESNCYVIDSEIGDSVQIRANSYIEKSKISNKCSVGPFARLRPDTELGEEAHVGNFVEFKKVKFGARSKAGHLTYLGDAEIGEEVNIGCGTITCNYAVDRKKYKTIIGNRVFVGSDSQFVAPVSVGDDAVIGSGSTITKDVPAKALAVARAKQFIKENYSDKLISAEEELDKKE